MLSRLSSFLRSGVIALAALATVPATAPAAPLGPSIMPAVADSTVGPILVGDGYQGNGRSGGPGYWPRVGRGGGNWVGRGNWNGGGWNGGGRWNGGKWRGRHYGRGYGHGYYGHNYYNDSGIYLGLGLGALALGSAFYNGYYNDPYYYNEPVYRPRYVRRGVASTHEEWCYNRYRSYRDWDNTFQPYHGPRRQCHSPFG